MDRKEPRSSAKYNGFDVHCAVRVADDDDEGRERLIRTCARAPFALERIELVKDGRIAHQLKRAPSSARDSPASERLQGRKPYGVPCSIGLSEFDRRK